MPTDGGGRPADIAPRVEVAKLREARPRALLIRFVLGASVSVGAGIIAKLVGARFGGVFLAFPAILPASLTLIEEKEGTRRADRDAIGAVLGGVALAVFAGTGEIAFGHVPSGVAIPSMLLAWMVTAVALYALLAFLRPQDCDRARD